MLIKQRQVRRSSKFTSRWNRSTQQRREYVATLYTTGVVQFFLVIFSLVGAWRSWDLMQSRFPDLAWYIRLALPAIMVVIAALFARALFNNVRYALEANRPPPPPTGPGAPS